MINVLVPGIIIDSLVQHRDIKTIAIVTGGMILSNVLGGIIVNILNMKCNLYQTYVYNIFQVKLADKISHADLEQLESKEYMDMKERAFKFLYANGRGFAAILNDAFDIIGKIFSFIAIISIIAAFNISIIILLIVMVVITSIVDTNAKRASYKMDLAKAPYERKTAYYIDLLSNYTYGKEVRTNNLYDWLTKKYIKQLAITRMFYKKSGEKICMASNLNQICNFIQSGIVYTYLIIKFIGGQISIGNFTVYLNAINSFANSIKDIMNSVTNIYAFKPYYDAVEEFCSIPNYNNTSVKKLEKKRNHTITFQNVSFRYAGTSNDALKNINITIEPGKKYSIVGENGAGKTTFVKLLTRMYRPTEGSILLDGMNIENIDYEDYMSVFSSVYQDFKLFSFTVKENIALSKSDNTPDKTVNAIIHQVGLDKRMESLEKGIDTDIYKTFSDNNCFEPSGGEAQKIAMARAIFKNSPIMILDEPASALDPRAENELYENFHSITNEKTAIYISHRLTSCRLSDTIFVFQEGKIIEQGSHEELMDHGTVYKELYEMQAKYYIDD